MQIMNKIKSLFKYSKKGFFYLFSYDFIDESKESSIDFFKRDDSLLSDDMIKYLEKKSNKEKYISQEILKKECKVKDLETA